MQRISLRKEPRLDARHEAFAYQSEAVQALRDLDYGAIFHEQGLGKTKIAVDLMLYWLEKKVVDTVLVVVKKGLLQNWQDELAMHTFLTPRILGQNRRANFFVFNSPCRVALTHYEVLKSEKKRMTLFLKAREVGVILDESTKIKNPDASLTKVFHDMAPLFKRRVIMTGTPIANRPHDLWSQIWFLDQGASLGNDFTVFKKDMDLSNKLAGSAEAQERFESRLESLSRNSGQTRIRILTGLGGKAMFGIRYKSDWWDFNVLESWGICRRSLSSLWAGNRCVNRYMGNTSYRVHG